MLAVTLMKATSDVDSVVGFFFYLQPLKPYSEHDAKGLAILKVKDASYNIKRFAFNT